MQQLRRLAAGRLPLPNADYAAQLEGVGLPWRSKKVSMLKHCTVLKPPQVRRCSMVAIRFKLCPRIERYRCIDTVAIAQCVNAEALLRADAATGEATSCRDACVLAWLDPCEA